MVAIASVKQSSNGSCYTYDSNGIQIGSICVEPTYKLVGYTSDTVSIQAPHGTIYIYDAWGNLKNSIV